MIGSPEHGEHPHELSDLTPVRDRDTAQNNTSAENQPGIDIPSDANSLETNLTFIVKTIPQFMVVAKRKGRKAKAQKKRARKLLFNKAFEKIFTAIGVILAAGGLTWTVYSNYRWSAPANIISQEGLDAANLANYYAYIFTICPAYEAKNMSTPACDEARNQTMPAPRKPSSLQPGNIEQLVARQLTNFINGSVEFQSMIQATDVYCSPNTSRTFGDSVYPACSILYPSVAYPPPSEHPLGRIQARSVFELIPLPPTPGARNVSSVLYWLDLCTTIISVALCLYPYIIFYRKSRTSHTIQPFDTRPRVTSLSKICDFVEVRLFSSFYLIYWPIGAILALFILSPGAILEIWNLSKWLAADAFLDSCLENTFHNPGTVSSATCNHVLSRTAQLSIEEQITIWSLWRAYLFSEIRRASLSPMLKGWMLNAVGLAIHLLWWLRRWVVERCANTSDKFDEGLEYDEKV